MRYRVLPFDLARETKKQPATALGGLAPYLELLCAAGVPASVRRNIPARSGQGWTDVQMVMALVTLNLAGGTCVDDMRILEGDQAFGRLFRMAEEYGLPRAARSELGTRFRKGRSRSVPSPSATFRYLASYHDQAQEELRTAGRAFIPAPTEALRGLYRVNADLLAFVQQHRPVNCATLDMDATLVQTHKREALYSYQGEKAYQPHNVYWAERDMFVHSEFRDGNVGAGCEQLRVLIAALDMLPTSIKKVRLRSDTAGYQHELLRYCDRGNTRFGKIEFAVRCDVCTQFRQAVAEVDPSAWKPVYKRQDGELFCTGREWAEVRTYLPGVLAYSKSGPDFRFIATREPLRNQPLPDLVEQMELPFQTVTMEAGTSRLTYRVFGTVTNMKGSGAAILQWANDRCGKSEEAHAVLKTDLAGGQMPTGAFGANAAWWQCAVLAYNAHVIMKTLALPTSWKGKRLKAIRFGLINTGGNLVSHAARTTLRLCADTVQFGIIVDARRAIFALTQPPR